MTARLGQFFEQCQHDPHYWESISPRVQNRYNWQLYADRLMSNKRLFFSCYGLQCAVATVDK